MSMLERAAMSAVILLTFVASPVRADTRRVYPSNAWAIGVFPGLWESARTASDQGRHYGTAIDFSVERRLVRSERAPTLRVQFGQGQGEGPGRPGFDYRRVMIGGTWKLTKPSQEPYTVYVAAGVGTYAMRSAVLRETRPSVYGALGLDVRLGSSPLSIGGELQVHTIGGARYGTTSFSARIHFF